MHSSHSTKVSLLEKADFERRVLEREEKERACWKLTGSRKGLSEFRSRLRDRRNIVISYINIILVIIFIIVIWELVKGIFKEEGSENQEETQIPNMLARCIKIRHLDMTH